MGEACWPPEPEPELERNRFVDDQDDGHVEQLHVRERQRPVQRRPSPRTSPSPREVAEVSGSVTAGGDGAPSVKAKQEPLPPMLRNILWVLMVILLINLYL